MFARRLVKAVKDGGGHGYVRLVGVVGTEVVVMEPLMALG